MSRVLKVVLTVCSLTAFAALATACGSQSISGVPGGPIHQGAVLFNQRCSGCHTLSYAATHGSAANVRTKQFNNGPDFGVRCERPLTRVLYAIENGGFSGAIMPQNIVVGQDAIDVAQFVATYAGRQSPAVPGVVQCAKEPIGTVPALTPAGTSTAAPTARQAAKVKSQGAGKAYSGVGAGAQTGKPGPKKKP